MDILIDVNKPELAHIREYLTAQRRGETYDSDAGDTVIELLRRIGAAALDQHMDASVKEGECFACGCTEKDACPPGCSWDPDYGQRLCDHCSGA